MARSSVFVDPQGGPVVVVEQGIDIDEQFSNVVREHPELRALAEWSESVTKGGNRRKGGLLERDRYVTPTKIHELFRVCYDAAGDDVVGGAIESSESLAFSKMNFLHKDEDEEDVWNQWAGDVDLDSRMREMWRENQIISQFYGAIWWGTKTYRVRGEGEGGRPRRKTFDDLRMPTAITVLDPLKVVPVGNFWFGQEDLAWIATRTEAEALEKGTDPMIGPLILGRYDPKREEESELRAHGIDSKNLFVMNPAATFRHTATRSGYQRFAKVRLAGILELLDQKHQLRQMDRAFLVGGTNFIILVKKGSDKQPGQPDEIAHLQTQVTKLSSTPIIVGDQRLSIEIVIPKGEKTLDPDRYNTIDSRIAARLYKMFFTGSSVSGTRSDDSLKLARVVARGLESDRHMLRRTLERVVLKPTVAKNSVFTRIPKLTFHPRRIALDFDSALATMLMDLRDRGDVSRASILDEVGLDQDEERILREREAESGADEVFQTTNPWGGGSEDSDGGGRRPKEDPKTSGRTKGGRRQGGGAAPGTGQGQAPRGRKPKDT